MLLSSRTGPTGRLDAQRASATRGPGGAAPVEGVCPLHENGDQVVSVAPDGRSGALLLAPSRPNHALRRRSLWSAQPKRTGAWRTPMTGAPARDDLDDGVLVALQAAAARSPALFAVPLLVLILSRYR